MLRFSQELYWGSILTITTKDFGYFHVFVQKGKGYRKGYISHTTPHPKKDPTQIMNTLAEKLGGSYPEDETVEGTIVFRVPEGVAENQAKWGVSSGLGPDEYELADYIAKAIGLGVYVVEWGV